MDILTTIKNLVSGWQGYLLAGGLALLMGAAGGAYAGYRWETGTVATLKLQAAQAQIQAVQAADRSRAAQDAVALAAAVREAQAQTKIQTVTQTITKEIPKYVPAPQETAAADRPGCVSFGLVRVLVGAQDGTDPGTLSLPASQSDDACTALGWADVASAVAADFGAARANAEQLTALQDWAVANQKAQESVQ